MSRSSYKWYCSLYAIKYHYGFFLFIWSWVRYKENSITDVMSVMNYWVTKVWNHYTIIFHTRTLTGVNAGNPYSFYGQSLWMPFQDNFRQNKVCVEVRQFWQHFFLPKVLVPFHSYDSQWRVLFNEYNKVAQLPFCYIHLTLDLVIKMMRFLQRRLLFVAFPLMKESTWLRWLRQILANHQEMLPKIQVLREQIVHSC